MKFAALFLATLATVQGFAPAAFTRSVQTTRVFSEPAEEDGLDLNLEEMFEMFDAADKEEDFDSAVEKVKGKES